MCCRRRAEAPKPCLASTSCHKPGKSVTVPQESKGKEAAMTATNLRSPVHHQIGDDARLSQNNGEVLRNADAPPPAYEDVVVSDSQPQSQPQPFAKVERDLQHYSNQREGIATSSSNGNAPHKQHSAALEDDDDLSDAESFDSDWDNETIAGINTPATTVVGDNDHKHGAQHDDKESLSREISNSSPSLLEYIRAQNDPPNVGSWSKEDWKAAKAAFKAERREARARFRAERRNLRAAWMAERRENRRAGREEKREFRELRRAGIHDAS